MRIGQPEGQPEIFVRVGKYGPFLEQGDRRASIPDQTPPDELTLESALKLLDTSAQSEEPLGHDPAGKPVYLKVGRFGPYLQLGTTDDDEKPLNRSLPKGVNPDDVTLELARKILALPRTLGNHPQTSQPILAFDGKFGPYIRCGDEQSKETRSLPAGLSPLDVTLEQALDLSGAAQGTRPRTRRRKTRAAEGIRGLARNGQSRATALRPLTVPT